MTLVKCRECKKDVSSSAKTCPHCGIDDPAPPPPKAITYTGKEFVGILILCCFMFVGLGIYNKNSKDKERANAAAAAEGDAQCKSDLQCWGDRATIGAGIYCRDAVEKLAKYSARWTDGTLEPKFSRFRWLNKDSGTLTMVGDKIQFQNGFGAYQSAVYECDYNPTTHAVLAVRAEPGRL